MVNSRQSFNVYLNTTSPHRPTVAVIGGGVAGMSAARTLIKGGARVILIESSSHLGGNCCGVEVTASDGTRHRVDAGVSDFNRSTFKELSAIIDELGLKTHPISQDLSVTSKSGESLLSGIDGVIECAPEYGSSTEIAQEMKDFRVRCEEVIKNPKFSGWTISQYLDHVGASKALRDAFVLPRAMGSFPMPDMAAEDMPIEEIVRFWLIHGIVGSIPANRHTVEGGMYRYMEKLSESLEKDGVDIRCNSRVFSVSRLPDRVEIHMCDDNGRTTVLCVDQVVFTIHARNVLPLIADDAGVEEVSALAGFKIQRARIVVHHDASLMAADRSKWGAFNYVAQEGSWPTERPTITFYPNKLGRLLSDVPDTFVTMNPYHEPRPETIVSDAYLVHPVAVGGEPGKKAIAALEKLQGERRTWWAGSYLRSPYVHESAWITGRVAAEKLLAETSRPVAESAEGSDLHEITIAFVDEAKGDTGARRTFDVKVKLRAPRKLAIKGARVL